MGEEPLPLVKTPCCEQWICCDTAFISFSGDDRCQFEHEAYSICYFHYNEKHSGAWQECAECRNLFDQEKFVDELSFKLK